MRTYSYAESNISGTDAVNVMNNLGKKYYGLRIEGIAPNSRCSLFYIFFSYEDLMVNRVERNEEYQEPDDDE